MLLYPRLPQTIARMLAAERTSMSLAQLYSISNINYSGAIYAPTGGNRVDSHLLLAIQQNLRESAHRCGYPGTSNDILKRAFDAESGEILHEKMGITPAEASAQGMWAFMACILVPDIVRWRFPGTGNGTTPERFLGGSRGLRNMLGRVWWRAYLLYQEDTKQPYELLTKFGEDELVQIMERPNIAGNPILVKNLCFIFLKTIDQHPEISRSELLRDAMKRLRRIFPLTSFNAIDQEAVQNIIDGIFKEAIAALRI